MGKSKKVIKGAHKKVKHQQYKENDTAYKNKVRKAIKRFRGLKKNKMMSLGEFEKAFKEWAKKNNFQIKENIKIE